MTHKAKDRDQAATDNDRLADVSGFDPRATDHPTGESDAADNAANDLPG